MPEALYVVITSPRSGFLLGSRLSSPLVRDFWLEINVDLAAT